MSITCMEFVKLISDNYGIIVPQKIGPSKVAALDDGRFYMQPQSMKNRSISEEEFLDALARNISFYKLNGSEGIEEAINHSRVQYLERVFSEVAKESLNNFDRPCYSMYFGVIASLTDRHTELMAVRSQAKSEGELEFNLKKHFENFPGSNKKVIDYAAYSIPTDQINLLGTDILQFRPWLR